MRGSGRQAGFGLACAAVAAALASSYGVAAHNLLSGAMGPTLSVATELATTDLPYLAQQTDEIGAAQPPAGRPDLRHLMTVPQDDHKPIPVEPHPVAVALPDHDVVVCVAGCVRSPNSIVYSKRRGSAPAQGGGLIRVADVSGTAKASETVQCMAGCYGRSATVPGQRPGAGPTGTWITAPQGITSDAKGEVDSVRVTKGQRQRTKKIGSGDWFSKRFREDAGRE